MPSVFTVEELKALAAWGDGLLEALQATRPDYLPPNEDHALRVKLAELIERHEVGVCVFHLELAITNPNTKARRRRRSPGEKPPVWSPTLNEYNGLQGWAKSELRTAMDWRIVEAMTRWESCHMGIKREPGKRGRVGRLVTRGRARRRLVRVYRESSGRPDEIAADIIGGKIPIDRLVQAGILLDDTAEWCVRESQWQQVAKGCGRVVISVFELKE